MKGGQVAEFPSCVIRRRRAANPAGGGGIFGVGSCLICSLDPPVKPAGDERGLDPSVGPVGDEERMDGDDEGKVSGGDDSVIRNRP